MASWKQAAQLLLWQPIVLPTTDDKLLFLRLIFGALYILIVANDTSYSVSTDK